MGRRDRDDFDDDRPRRRGADRTSGSGLRIALILIGGATIVIVLAGLAAAAFFAFRTPRLEGPQTPDAPVTDIGPVPRLVVEPGPPLVPVPTAGRSVNQLVFAGGENGSTALVSYRDQGVGYRIDVIETANGKARGQVVTEAVSIYGVAVSPDGKWVVVIESGPGEGHPVVLYDVAAGKKADRFRPYPRIGPDAFQAPELAWAGFVSPDRLLTINEASGFDLWSVPKLERIAGQPSRKGSALTRVAVNGFTHAPTNFALTPDGKTLILFNGTGFTVYDAQTAGALRETPPIMKEGGLATFWAAAVRADGSRFACYFRTYGPQEETALIVWDVQTGKQVSKIQPRGNSSPPGMGWWGPDHFLLWQGGISTADVMKASTAEIVAKVRFRETGVLATVPPTDGLWGLTPSSRIAVRDDPILIRGVLPPAFRLGAQFRLDTKGIHEE
jgi:hypothetical protein